MQIIETGRIGGADFRQFATDSRHGSSQFVQRCRDQLASFKVPRSFVRVESLPRTALGKVQKHLLPPL